MKQKYYVGIYEGHWNGEKIADSVCTDSMGRVDKKTFNLINFDGQANGEPLFIRFPESALQEMKRFCEDDMIRQLTDEEVMEFYPTA